MSKAPQDLSEKVLANVTYLVELENVEAARMLKLCSIEINEHSDDGEQSFFEFLWFIEIKCPREVYKILRDENNPLTCSIKDAFGSVSNSFNAELHKFSPLIQVIEFESNWREGAEIAILDERILASTISFLMEGDSTDKQTASLLSECVLITNKKLEDSPFSTEPKKILQCEFRCSRKSYELFSEANNKFRKAIEKSINAVLPNCYFNHSIEFVFKYKLLSNLRQREEANFFEDSSKENNDIDPLKNLISSLKQQQTDFIGRLRLGLSKTLRCETKGFHSELTVIANDDLKQLRDFCWRMADKFKSSRTDIKDLFVNTLKGKLGEEAFYLRLGERVSEVDYESRKGGDGKIDFQLSSTPSVGIQVKTRNGNPHNTRWFVSKEEVEKNKVIACFLIQEEVSEAQQEYNIIFAGFISTDMINDSDFKGEKQVKLPINELLYSGGIKAYLDLLEENFQQVELIEALERSVKKQTLHIELTPEIKDIWTKVLREIKPYSTQVTVKQQLSLISFDGQKALFYVASQPLLKFVHGKTSQIEEAFYAVLNKNVEVVIEVKP